MFYIATKTRTASRKPGGFRWLRRNSAVVLEECIVCGRGYGILRINEGRNPLDWAEIAERYAIAPNELVVGYGIVLPESCGKLLFDSFPYRRQLCVNACIDVIRRTQIPLYRKTAAVFDRTGANLDLCETLLPHFCHIDVYSQQRARVNQKSEALMRRYGEPLHYRTFQQIEDRYTAILDPEGILTTPMQTSAVFTLGENRSGSRICIHGYDIDIPFITQMTPVDDVDKISLAAVFCAKGLMRGLRGVIPSRLLIADNTISTGMLAQVIAGIDVRRRRNGSGGSF